MSSLYMNTNGMVCCVDHGGSYLRSEYRHDPEQNVYVTPIEAWYQVEDVDVVEWETLVGHAPRCEVCR